MFTQFFEGFFLGIKRNVQFVCPSVSPAAENENIKETP